MADRPLATTASSGTQDPRYDRRVVFPPLPQSVAVARHLVATALGEATTRLPGPGERALVEVAELLVSELATNAVRYCRGPFELRVQFGPRLRVEVHDSSAELPVPSHVALNADHGRGLRILQALAAAWGAEPTLQGKVVWFEL